MYLNKIKMRGGRCNTWKKRQLLCPYSPTGNHQKMMFLENAICLVKQRALGSNITVEAKAEKTRL